MFGTSASYVRMVRQRTGADGLATAHVSSGTDLGRERSFATQLGSVVRELLSWDARR